MSHRPLDTLKKEHRAADRAPHLRTRRNGPNTDVIDGLDTIGGAYHHGGPYDATLASRNANQKYAPLDAVRDSNMEAIRATPREYMQDSLDKHVPLQGTSTIPSGSRDLSGKIMTYEEGADMMRESGAAGGAYKRWDFIQYHPDDLKGKGEPSYTYERDLKEKQRQRRSLGLGNTEYEMQSGVNRQRSSSNTADSRSGAYHALNQPADSGFSNSADVNRSNSTSKRFSDGFKRRFGSLRHKRNVSTEA